MKWATFAAACGGVSLAAFGLIAEVHPRLIWNRTHSAPIGLYRLSSDPVSLGDWALMSASSDPARWAQNRGFVGPNWPLLKRISALPGDEICRIGAMISINGEPVASALASDTRGRLLPVWTGCAILSEDQVFLLNAHPRSLDGRYFGPASVSDLDGVAVEVLTFGHR